MEGCFEAFSQLFELMRVLEVVGWICVINFVEGGSLEDILIYRLEGSIRHAQILAERGCAGEICPRSITHYVRICSILF